ncbi:hypothetical protein BCR33DRAFT_722173 [Rhizoclosmatium globosum]|uniref:Uncharacterized protein n=1 Tax=Rhizoclosmatium globosum TaxID=329046 RepID=A0A1Y2BNN6_9FUNG|nr:hypothetical protein BCR33DRAFT_722173 [Rhizoclosmatium globosum]|eukprot:ORY36369.1 hypothetical protein BCR33DRAFT_722173 [Rhizoclosmatium globosum]
MSLLLKPAIPVPDPTAYSWDSNIVSQSPESQSVIQSPLPAQIPTIPIVWETEPIASFAPEISNSTTTSKSDVNAINIITTAAVPPATGNAGTGSGIWNQPPFSSLPSLQLQPATFQPPVQWDEQSNGNTALLTQQQIQKVPATVLTAVKLITPPPPASPQTKPNTAAPSKQYSILHPSITSSKASYPSSQTTKTLPPPLPSPQQQTRTDAPTLPPPSPIILPSVDQSSTQEAHSTALDSSPNTPLLYTAIASVLLVLLICILAATAWYISYRRRKPVPNPTTTATPARTFWRRTRRNSTRRDATRPPDQRWSLRSCSDLQWRERVSGGGWNGWGERGVVSGVYTESEAGSGVWDTRGKPVTREMSRSVWSVGARHVVVVDEGGLSDVGEERGVWRGEGSRSSGSSSSSSRSEKTSLSTLGVRRRLGSFFGGWRASSSNLRAHVPDSIKSQESNASGSGEGSWETPRDGKRYQDFSRNQPLYTPSTRSLEK